MNYDAFIHDLKRFLDPGQVLTSPESCWPYGSDRSSQHVLPEVVVFPTSEAQVQRIINLCNQYSVPVTPRGLGTGTPGGAVPLFGGLVISLEKMNRILELDTKNRVMVVEPGVTNLAVQEAAAKFGFFWAPDPGSAANCTVGGNLAYNAAGPHAVKYGTTRENVLALRGITGNGELIKTGVYTTKGVVGYDLTRLLIGSEGTLAIITEATLRLLPLPETRRTLCACYKDVEGATAAVVSIMSQAITPSALEFMDKQSIDMIRYCPTTAKPTVFNELPEATAALLLIEVDGQQSSIEDMITKISQAAKNESLMAVIAAGNEEESNQLWGVRKALSLALRYIAPKKINEDIVVPVSEIPALLTGLNKLAEYYKIVIVNFGHAGNGNIHVNLMIDPDDPMQAKNAVLCLNEVFSLVIKLKGTLSGEHGIGIEKRDFMPQAVDRMALNLMQKIKQQFDPNGILNPGKIFPLQVG